MIAVELRRLLLAEERLEDDDLAEADEDDGHGHEGRPHHDPLVQILGAFATLKRSVSEDTLKPFRQIPHFRVLAFKFSQIAQR